MENLYWKIRKTKNDLIFNIKVLLHKGRDFNENKKDDASFKKSVTKEVFKSFSKNIFLIAVILVIERCLLLVQSTHLEFPLIANLYSWILNVDKNIMENTQTFAEVLAVLIGVAGVFLGLYCANIMSMYAERYANASKRMVKLFENDIISNKCIQAITNYLLFSIIILFLIVIKVPIGIIVLIAASAKGFEIIVSFSFMSRRAYEFSDTYCVANAVYRDMYRVFEHLNKGSLFTRDKNFQNHYKKQAKRFLSDLAEINDYNLEKEEKISLSVETFMNNNLALIYSYWNVKEKVPYDSSWYDDKVIYKKWYKTTDIETTTALETGTLLGHDLEKNQLWFEEEIEKINDSCLKYLISKKSFAAVIRWLSTLETLAERAVESGNVGYYVDYLYKLQQTLQKTLAEGELSLEEEMALAEHIVVSYLTVLITIRKYVEKNDKDNYLCSIKSFKGKKWEFPNRFYNRKDIRKLHEAVLVEVKLEGKRITPEWYINQAVSKHYYEELLHMYKIIDAIANQYIPKLTEQLVEQKRTAGAMIIYAKYSEIKSKLGIVERVLDVRLKQVMELHKEKTIIWEEMPATTAANKFEAIYKGMSTEWCKCTGEFAIQNWESYEKYPDVLGACVTYLCDILVENLIDDDFEKFALNYKNLFGMQLIYQEYSRKELLSIKEQHKQSVVLAVYSNPIIEYSMISGYAYLWGEISGDERWKELVIEDTQKHIQKDEVGEKVASILQASQNRMPGFYPRHMLHTRWCQSIETMIRKKETLCWKYGRFYEEYDGESKLLKAVLSKKNHYDLLNYDSYEIYAIAVLNQHIEEDKRYHSRDGWEEEYYEK